LLFQVDASMKLPETAGTPEAATVPVMLAIVGFCVLWLTVLTFGRPVIWLMPSDPKPCQVTNWVLVELAELGEGLAGIESKAKPDVHPK
jgi:hypothetical protein